MARAANPGSHPLGEKRGTGGPTLRVHERRQAFCFFFSFPEQYLFVLALLSGFDFVCVFLQGARKRVVLHGEGRRSNCNGWHLGVRLYVCFVCERLEENCQSGNRVWTIQRRRTFLIFVLHKTKAAIYSVAALFPCKEGFNTTGRVFFFFFSLLCSFSGCFQSARQRLFLGY